MDYRSLALFRVGLGLTMFGDLWDRSNDLHAHYTDLGRDDRLRTPSYSYRSLPSRAGGHRTFTSLHVLRPLILLRLAVQLQCVSHDWHILWRRLPLHHSLNLCSVLCSRCVP